MVKYHKTEKHKSLVEINILLGHVLHALNREDVSINYFKNALDIN